MFGLGRVKEAPLHDEITRYFARIAALEARVTALELNQDALRDKVLRKIQERHATPEPEKVKPVLGMKVRRNG